MDSVRVVRIALVAEISLTVASVAGEFLLEGFLPQPLQAYMAAEQESPLRASEVVFLLLGLPLLGLTVVAWIGLWRWWKRAEPLYLVASVGLVVLGLLAGPTVQTALGATVDHAGSLVRGLILGLLYSSPLRERFAASA